MPKHTYGFGVLSFRERILTWVAYLRRSGCEGRGNGEEGAEGEVDAEGLGIYSDLHWSHVLRFPWIPIDVQNWNTRRVHVFYMNHG